MDTSKYNRTDPVGQSTAVCLFRDSADTNSVQKSVRLCPLFRNTRQPLGNFTPSPGKTLTLGARLFIASRSWQHTSENTKYIQRQPLPSAQSSVCAFALDAWQNETPYTYRPIKKPQISRPRAYLTLADVLEMPYTQNTQAPKRYEF